MIFRYIDPKRYKILAKPLTEAMLSEIEEAVYTGSPIKPDVTVTDGSTQLEQGRDYTVSYKKNISVGTATMTVKGKGNYAGTVKVPFTIQPVNMENNPQIRIRVSDMAYTGKAVRQTVQVYAGEKKITVIFEIGQADITDAVVGKIPNQTLKGMAVKPIPKVKVGRNTLKAGRDFTVSYLRNGVKGEAEMIITGIGNYTGSCRKTFIVQ